MKISTRNWAAFSISQIRRTRLFLNTKEGHEAKFAEPGLERGKHMIDLDQMKETWTEHDRKLEENIRLNRQLLRTIQLKEGRSRLQRLLGLTAVHALMWVGCKVALGNFIYEHIGPRFALSAVSLDLYAIGFLIALIRQMIIVGGIDYGQPITAIQKQLETVRILRIRTTPMGCAGRHCRLGAFSDCGISGILRSGHFSLVWSTLGNGECAVWRLSSP